MCELLHVRVCVDRYNLRGRQPFANVEPLVEVRRSRICSGFGLFARVPIEGDTLVCRYSGRCVDGHHAVHSTSKYILGPVSSTVETSKQGKVVTRHWYIDSTETFNHSGRYLNKNDGDPNCVWDFPDNISKMLYDRTIDRWYVNVKTAYDVEQDAELDIHYGFDLDDINDPVTGKLINDFEFDMDKVE